MKKTLPIIYILIAGCMWGCMGLAVRPLNEQGLATMEITFLRGIITCVVMFMGLLIFDRRALRIKGKDIWCFIGTGSLSVCFFNFSYFKTITATSLSVAAVLLYTAPAFVMLMSGLLFREKITFRKIVAVVLAFAGCVLVSGMLGGATHLSLVGVLYGIGAGFGYALYSIFGRYALNKGYSSITITFYTFFFCAVSSILYVDSFSVIKTVCQSGELLIWTVGMMLFVTLVPYLAYTKGLSNVENGTASIVASIEPVVATLLGIIVYREKLDWFILWGMILVLCSVIIINKPHKLYKNKNKKSL